MWLPKVVLRIELLGITQLQTWALEFPEHPCVALSGLDQYDYILQGSCVHIFPGIPSVQFWSVYYSSARH